MRFFLIMLLAFYGMYTINKIINRLIRKKDSQENLPKKPFRRDDIEDAVYTEIEEGKDSSGKK